MKQLRQRPYLLILSLLILTGFACQISGVAPAEPAAEVDVDAIVNEVAATVAAQIPVAPTGAPVTVNSQLEPVNLDLQNTLINVYEAVNPGVVHIFVFEAYQGKNIPLGTGSGFIFDSEGYIITNNHVITDGDAYEVVFADGQRSTAAIVGTDVDSDLAVLKVDTLPANARVLPLGDSNNLQVGQFVIAIGNPFGENGSMSIGIISGLGRTIDSQREIEGGGRYSLPQVIQTDAAINPGNSGGPLLNLNGEVVGVNSSILTRTGTNSGVGFSIPVNAVKKIAPAIVADGFYVYPFIGIRMFDPLDVDIATQNELNLPSAGVLITDVSLDTPASEAGLIGGAEGDFITAIDGIAIRNTDDLISYLVFETEVGQTIELTVLRNDEQIIVPLTLGARP